MQALLNATMDVICSVNAEGRFVYISAAAQQLWGYAPHELVGRKYTDLVIAANHQKTKAVAAAVMAGAEVTAFENYLSRKDGAVVPMLWSARWCPKEQLFYCVAKDATQLKNAEKKRHMQDRRLHRAYVLAGLAWWEYDVATKTYTASDEIFVMYGLPIPENNQITLGGFLSCVHPDDVPKLQHDLATISYDTYVNYEHRVVKPDGDVITVIHYSEVVRNAEGHPLSIYGTTKEITESKYYLELEKLERHILALSAKRTASLAEILNIYARGIESLHDGTICSISQSRDGRLYVLAAPNMPSSYKALLKEGIFIAADNGSSGTAAYLKEKVIATDIATDPRWHQWKEAALAHNFQACWATPIMDADGNAAAVFALYYTRLKTPSALEENTIHRATSILQLLLESERKKLALQLAHERFELVSKATRDAVWDWDIQTNTCYFSEAFSSYFGYENRSGMIQNNWADNIHSEDKQPILISVNDALNDPNVLQWEGEYRFCRKDKSIAYVLDRAFIIRDSNGVALRIVGSMQDITKMKETEEEMKKLSLVAKETGNVVIITDASERITWVNKAFTDITGYTAEEAIGKNPGKLLQGPATCAKTKRYLRQCIEQQEPFACEIVNYTKSGEAYWVEIKGQPLFDEAGKLKQYFAIQTDVTARKEAEAVIKLSEEKYKLLFYSSPRPMYIFNAETLRFVDVNNAACALYGYSKEEFLKLCIQDLQLPEDEAEMIKIMQALKNRKSRHFQRILRHRKKSGTLFSIEIAGFAIQLAAKMHFMVTGTDMTEKLQLQKQLIAEKVETQKQVARAIIQAQETERSEIGRELHDNVCQLLTTAKLYIENSKHFPAQQHEFTHKGVELLLQSINEIRYLSRQLVSPVSNDAGFEDSVNELIRHYRSMHLFDICFTYQANVELLDKDLKTSIIRILQEQFNNTVKYAKASMVKLHISNTDDLLLLHYEDNGVGFDPTTAKKGIGLINISNRASAYRGEVKLTAAVGGGCQMQVTFPISPKEVYA